MTLIASAHISLTTTSCMVPSHCRALENGGRDKMLVEHLCLCEIRLLDTLRASSEKEHKVPNILFPKG